MQPQTGIYLLYLWRDGLPSGRTDAFLQRAHTAGWGVNSPFLGAAGGAFLSRWNGLSSESLFYSLESWGRYKGTLSVCHSVDSSRQDCISASFNLQWNSTSIRRDPHLQHSWNVLSGLPSDSDFVWTISHTAEPSPSAEEIDTRDLMYRASWFSEIIVSGF